MYMVKGQMQINDGQPIYIIAIPHHPKNKIYEANHHPFNLQLSLVFRLLIKHKIIPHTPLMS